MSEPLIQTPCMFGTNEAFVLERELGSGGMGGVYMGRDKMLDRPVAVKVMLKELGSDTTFIEKFKKEAQSSAKLIHPHIAQIYSYGIYNGMPYIAMELASGGSLYSMMNVAPGKTDVTRVIKICQQVAQALQCASDQGFVHGDVKPENILFDANGNAKLIDFGLAGMQKDTNEIWGTPYYIAPEKVKKEAIDFRADMYSLGGTLYHALTGVAPFEGADPIAVVKKRFEGAPQKPSEIRKDLTPAIDALVLKMLALKKEDRFPSFEALIAAFNSVLTTGLSVAAKTAVNPAGSAGKKSTLAVKRRRIIPTHKKTTSPSAIKPANISARMKTDIAVENLSAEEDEEQGGNIGLKVLGVVFSVVLGIGAIVGGLAWYQHADKQSRANDLQSQIDKGIESAKSAIKNTVEAAAKFADDFDEFAEKAIQECQKPMDELMKVLPPEQVASFNPGPTDELLAAIASTNIVEGATNVTASATNATMIATGSATNGTATAAASGQSGEKTEEAALEGEVSTNAAPAEIKSSLIGTAKAMKELWERAYGCKACAIRIRKKINAIVEKGKTADELTAFTQANLEKLSDLSRTVVEEFEQVKVSKDVETVRKGIAFIRNKGSRTVTTTVNQLRAERLAAERNQKAEEEAKAEAERKARMEAEHKAKVEEESAAAKAMFEKVVAQGHIRQLEWRNALRQLEALKVETTTADGQLAVDREIAKVNKMKKVHDILKAELKGYEFKKGRREGLRGAKVVTILDDEFIAMRVDGKSKIRVYWQKFYKEYIGNFNEVINAFIANARSVNSKKRMSLREWADSMTGVALTLRLVCMDAPGAMERAEQIIKEIAKNFPEYINTLRDTFPDVTIEASEDL